MKKQLLTTTALVAAGVLTVSGAAHAQKPTLSLGGSTEQIFGYGENEDAFDQANGGRIGFDQHSETEVHFNGAVTLDNGIKIRTRVELEGNSNVAAGSSNGANGAAAAGNMDDIDENWMRISGSFGEVRLGSGDAAAQAMTTGYLGTWATGVGQNFAFDTGDWVTNPGTVSVSTVGRVDASSDAEHISYFTPRFAGFQAGLSYIPSTREDVNNQRELTAGADNYGWSMGLNYVGKFSGVGVGIAAGYATARENSNATVNGVQVEDPEVWGIGGRVDFSGFRVALSWVESEDQSRAGAAAANGQETLEAGARYTFGPNAVSVQYQHAEANSSQTAARNGDEATTFWLAYRRTLGPGVSFKVSAIFADFEDGAVGAAAGNSNDGQALTTAIQIRF